MNPRFQPQVQRLRGRIARQRARLDRRSIRLAGRAEMLLSWRGYWAEHPLSMLLAAAGAGMAASRLLSRSQSYQDVERRLFDLATSASATQLWHELVSAARGTSSNATEGTVSE